MYVQPNIGTLLKQPISTSESRLWQDEWRHTRRWYLNRKPEICIGLKRNDGKINRLNFFCVFCDSSLYSIRLHMQDVRLRATEPNVDFSHLIESFPIGLHWGMCTNGFLMLLSLVMWSYTCWERSNLALLSLLSESQTKQPDDWGFVDELGPVLTVPARL